MVEHASDSSESFFSSFGIQTFIFRISSEKQKIKKILGRKWFDFPWMLNQLSAQRCRFKSHSNHLIFLLYISFLFFSFLFVSFRLSFFWWKIWILHSKMFVFCKICEKLWIDKLWPVLQYRKKNWFPPETIIKQLFKNLYFVDYWTYGNKNYIKWKLITSTFTYLQSDFFHMCLLALANSFSEGRQNF